jgi:poly-gamma-glutamate synthesis protein (capsule biosynthesis protein)
LIETSEIYFPGEDYDFQNIKIKKDIKNLFNKESEEINNNILFSNKDSNLKEETNTFLFVGDMMFDRGVESLSIINNDFNYPFREINPFLNNIDYVIGNLEGPIMEEPVYYSDSSMTFSFNKEIVSILRNNNFDLVSLANNHTMNNNAFGETRGILLNGNIAFAGHPYTCLEEDIYENNDFILYALNTTYPFNCSMDEMLKIIPESDKFMIVMIHWGNEYEEVPSGYQIELAHKMIDSGVDLIIGSHPHVVQSIEKYNDKMIFYSLGNFIFDQYFSQKTQQGLLIGLEKYEDRLIYNLFLAESELAQPRISDNETFFENLINISSENLKEEIEDRKIIIYSKD